MERERQRAMASCADTPCPHLSIPVEMDESMTSSSLNLAWPACQKCSSHGHVSATKGVITVNDEEEFECSDKRLRDCRLQKVNGSVFPVAKSAYNRFSEVEGVHLHHLHPLLFCLKDEVCERSDCDYRTTESAFLLPSDVVESLEPPRSLRSEPAPAVPQNLAPFPVEPQRPKYPHYHPPHLNNHRPEHQRCMQARQSLHLNLGFPMVTPQHQVTTPARDVMSEVYVSPSRPLGLPEIKRTISLPEECRTVFITYSVDTAKEIFRFVAFLRNQGFRPAIDIFDSAVRQLDMNRWMDSYLKNKSVLIIVVISPRYKLDIEGDGSDQHGLHTKYIHSQIQNEFIQQRCLNFRIVPVLFPNANQSHIPMWLQSTPVFRWRQDAQDLLLRLLREERYIPPPREQNITLSIKTL